MSKKLKLKKKFKRRIIAILLVFLLTLVGINIYKTYKYHQTYEYKLLQVGYTKDQVGTILGKLKEEKILLLIASEKKDYVLDIINAKYYLEKNYNTYLSFYEKNKDTSIDDVIARVNVGAIRDWYQDATSTDTSKGYSMLTNKFHLLPSDYKVDSIKTFSATYAYGTVSAEETVYNQFISMAKSAKADGVTLVLTSGYRTREKQEKTYNDMLKSRGQEYADAYAARVGASEHETGYALDIVSNGKYVYTTNFHESPAYEWLSKNAADYGFILRYPDGKEYLTGYAPESWHYRYVGVDLAKKIKSEGITFDEYYAYYLE